MFLLRGRRETSAGVIHRGQWQNMLWVSTVALTLFSQRFHVCLHALHVCPLRHAGSTLSALTGISMFAFWLRQRKDREACSALSVPCWCHIHTCIRVWEPENVITSKDLQEVASAFKCCCYLNFKHSELFEELLWASMKKWHCSMGIFQQLTGAVTHVTMQIKTLSYLKSTRVWH